MGIRNDAKLKVHIVDAQNLEDSSYKVRVQQDNFASDSNVRFGSNPIWNEAIVFDINNPQEHVVVEVIDESTGNSCIKNELDLRSEEIMDYSN